jgi:hypothetical protein
MSEAAPSPPHGEGGPSKRHSDGSSPPDSANKKAPQVCVRCDLLTDWDELLESSKHNRPYPLCKNCGKTKPEGRYNFCTICRNWHPEVVHAIAFKMMRYCEPCRRLKVRENSRHYLSNKRARLAAQKEQAEAEEKDDSDLKSALDTPVYPTSDQPLHPQVRPEKLVVKALQQECVVCGTAVPPRKGPRSQLCDDCEKAAPLDHQFCRDCKSWWKSQKTERCALLRLCQGCVREKMRTRRRAQKLANENAIFDAQTPILSVSDRPQHLQGHQVSGQLEVENNLQGSSTRPTLTPTSNSGQFREAQVPEITSSTSTSSDHMQQPVFTFQGPEMYRCEGAVSITEPHEVPLNQLVLNGDVELCISCVESLGDQVVQS